MGSSSRCALLRPRAHVPGTDRRTLKGAGPASSCPRPHTGLTGHQQTRGEASYSCLLQAFGEPGLCPRALDSILLVASHPDPELIPAPQTQTLPQLPGQTLPSPPLPELVSSPRAWGPQLSEASRKGRRWARPPPMGSGAVQGGEGHSPSPLVTFPIGPPTLEGTHDPSGAQPDEPQAAFCRVALGRHAALPSPHE